jgi:hypothetical protein
MKAKKEMSRNPCGIHISQGRAPISAHQLYRVCWDDGTVTTERGAQIQTMRGIREVGESKKDERYRPELQSTMEAAYILMRDIGWACSEVDDKKDF